MLALIFFDSLLNYFSQTIIGLRIPTNVLLLLGIIILLERRGISIISIPRYYVIGITILVTGVAIGFVSTQDKVVFEDFAALAGSLVAFVVGLGAASRVGEQINWARLLLVIAISYAVVDVLALSKALPEYFPLKVHYWLSASGEGVGRPSITTNPNFEIFYSIPAGIILATTHNIKRLLLSLTLVVAAGYVLISLQTRSGVIIFIFLVMSSIILTIKKQRLAYILVVCSLFLGATVFATMKMANTIQDMPLTQRFEEHGSYNTLRGRIYSIEYLGEKMLLPSWWIGKGEKEFLERTGNIPHFTPTAMFLRGGLLALIGWILIFLIPFSILSIKYSIIVRNDWRVIVLLGGGASLLAQLTLNVPFYEHIWMWAGMVASVITKNKNIKII